jgi:hypothetical protein
MTLRIIALSIIRNNKMVISITILGIMKLSMTTVDAKCHYAKCQNA